MEEVTGKRKPKGPIKFQIVLTEEQKAYESGYLAGFHNKYDCPYPKDSN